MIVLDTNVLSEVLKPEPSQAVMAWLARQRPSQVFTTTITQAEMFYGVENLPLGKRRAKMYEAIEAVFASEFAGRIFSFDEPSARAFARIVASRQSMGEPISQLDAMIAAISRCRNADLATRNISHFEHCGVTLIDPWD